jgi:hypothetical protein
VKEFLYILQNEHSRLATNLIITAVESKPSRIEELMACFFSADNRISQRASWPVGDLGEKYPNLLLPYLPQCLTQLKLPQHNAIKRNIVRIWQSTELPEDLLGEIFDLCFGFITNPHEAIAVRVFSMTVCANICNRFPDLSGELILAIEDLLPNASPGLLNRGKKTISSLRKK